ncbi:hypothetical protein E3C22_13900 [Jiella endophytica]|uniref:Uncharacterized protein n=1 Tax=Jiella endophytica TaxID=2558362 RepID=A0A4Y8RH05_9HYPH|nr:hypothetical protein [Jiella endophytica]TFF21771.1 hypothetical protein E3C22_13900 [Jiella endophytica]
MTGSVFAYPYLWMVEEAKGIRDAKDRTTCLAIRRDVGGADGTTTHLMLLGITDQLWKGQKAVEVPDTEKRRAGLNPKRPAFVVVSEYNYDVLPHSWHYAPGTKTYGSFSSKFCKDIAEALKALSRQGGLAKVDRTRA